MESSSAKIAELNWRVRSEGDCLLVKEIVNEKHPYIRADELATKARAILRDFALRILPVVDENKKLLGIVSRSDVMAVSSSRSPIEVRGIMKSPKLTSVIEEDAFSIVRKMLKHNEWYVVVVNSVGDQFYKGVLGLEHFIEAIIKISPEKLSETAEEIMSREVITCSTEDELDNIWRLMQEKSLAGLPVTKDGKLVGIVTQKDLLERGTLLPTFESKKGRFKASTKISSMMNRNVISVKPHIKVIRVAKLMVTKDIGRVPVVDEEGKLVGIVDREDVAKLIIKQ